jgi:hypothetical protein
MSGHSSLHFGLLQVAGLPVYGVAIPTVSGLRLVLERLGAAQGRRKVLWHNQREEPVIYINGARQPRSRGAMLQPMQNALFWPSCALALEQGYPNGFARP